MIYSETLEIPANGAQIMATRKPALAYLRTSSKTNVGEDKDSHLRQLAAIEAFARRAAFVIVLPPYYDAGISGADAIDARPGFAAMLAYLAEHQEVRTILVETASRFARDLAVQIAGHDMLKARGIELVPADAPDYFRDETPTAVMVRQILGAVAQFEKAALVSRLRVARDRKRVAKGKCGGRKSHTEAHPETVKLARSLRWINKRMREKRSLRDIAATLAERGHVSRSGKPYGPSAVLSMLTG
jgi:DNA invertase Pin-like site-specific DNA recombinase